MMNKIAMDNMIRFQKDELSSSQSRFERVLRDLKTTDGSLVPAMLGDKRYYRLQKMPQDGLSWSYVKERHMRPIKVVKGRPKRVTTAGQKRRAPVAIKAVLPSSRRTDSTPNSAPQSKRDGEKADNSVEQSPNTYNTNELLDDLLATAFFEEPSLRTSDSLHWHWPIPAIISSLLSKMEVHYEGSSCDSTCNSSATEQQTPRDIIPLLEPVKKRVLDKFVREYGRYTLQTQTVLGRIGCVQPAILQIVSRTSFMCRPSIDRYMEKRESSMISKFSSFLTYTLTQRFG